MPVTDSTPDLLPLAGDLALIAFFPGVRGEAGVPSSAECGAVWELHAVGAVGAIFNCNRDALAA